MRSELLLGALGILIVAPGSAAALLSYRPAQIGIVTRCAAVFGLGFAVAGGCAFVLAVAHAFWLTTYLPLWLLATVALWVRAVRRAPLREHARAVAAEVADDRVPLLVGVTVIVVLLFVWGHYLHSLPGAHAVYILNGLEMANSHGIPASVLEFGQAWPPATDKVFLDAFTGVPLLIDNNPLLVPGILLWLAFAGAAVGLWAFAWELGLRRIGVLLPILMLANAQLTSGITNGFTFYRAEDFGMAVAFCALALGVSAIRTGGRDRALAAGIVLAVASASHLVPVVIVVVILASVMLAELVRRGRVRPRRATALDGCLLGVTGGTLGLVIRLLAGGSFGLGGASNEGSYAVVHTQFDPTYFMYSGGFLARNRVESGHFYITPGVVLQTVMHAATGLRLTSSMALVILAFGVVVALAFALVRTELGTVGFAGAGVLLAITAIGLYFSHRYHVWVEATFGIRRPTQYGAIGPILLVLGIVEGLLVLLGKLLWKAGSRLATALGIAIVIVAAVELVPAAMPTLANRERSTGQRVFATWVRTQTPCGARFVLNQRSEGSVALLTGRFALDEGMGAFLRPNRLPHVMDVLLAVRAFYSHPRTHEALLRSYDINYVVLAKPLLLGYLGPIPQSSVAKMQSAPFLQLVEQTPWFLVYHVAGSKVQPVSPLLKGPYLQCRTSPASF